MYAFALTSMTSVETPLPATFRPQRERRWVVTSRCRRTLTANGYLTEVVRLDGNRTGMPDEEVEKFVQRFPVEMIQRACLLAIERAASGIKTGEPKCRFRKRWRFARPTTDYGEYPAPKPASRN